MRVLLIILAACGAAIANEETAGDRSRADRVFALECIGKHDGETIYRGDKYFFKGDQAWLFELAPPEFEKLCEWVKPDERVDSMRIMEREI